MGKKMTKLKVTLYDQEIKITIIMKFALVDFCVIIPHCHLRSCIPLILKKKISTFIQSFQDYLIFHINIWKLAHGILEKESIL